MRGISFFTDISDNDLRQIAEITVERSYPKGAVIIEEMTEAERFFIIQTGKIEITKRFSGYEDFVISVQSDGDFFGEMALLDEGRRSATVRALEPTIVFEISRRDFETLLYKAPVLAYRIMKELILRLRESGALLISHLKQRNRQLLQAYIETMTSIIKAIEPQSATGTSVAAMVAAIGHEMRFADDDQLVIELCAVIHDLGSLTSTVMPALDKILPHILRQDGSFEGGGFADRIPVEAVHRANRLIALAEAYNSMTPGGATALRELRKGVPKRFDEEAIDALARLQASVSAAERTAKQ